MFLQVSHSFIHDVLLYTDILLFLLSSGSGPAAQSLIHFPQTFNHCTTVIIFLKIWDAPLPPCSLRPCCWPCPSLRSAVTRSMGVGHCGAGSFSIRAVLCASCYSRVKCVCACVRCCANHLYGSHVWLGVCMYLSYPWGNCSRPKASEPNSWVTFPQKSPLSIYFKL